MVLETIISSKYRIVTIVTLAILAAGLLGQTISSAIWWSRMQPWFGYGRGYYRVVYNCVFACFILSLVGFVVMVIVGAINIFAKELYAKLTGSLLGTTLVITIVGACALAGLIPGAYGASWAVDRYKIPTFKNVKGPNGQPQDIMRFLSDVGDHLLAFQKFGKDANAHFCAGYVTIGEIEEKNNWPAGSDKKKDYDEWRTKLEKKALETVKVEGGGTLSDLNKGLVQYLTPILQNEQITSQIDAVTLYKLNYGLASLPTPIPPLPNTYLCEEVGLPTLIFSMITALSMIVFFYLIVFNAYSQSDASEAEA